MKRFDKGLVSGLFTLAALSPDILKLVELLNEIHASLEIMPWRS